MFWCKPTHAKRRPRHADDCQRSSGECQLMKNKTQTLKDGSKEKLQGLLHMHHCMCILRWGEAL